MRDTGFVGRIDEWRRIEGACELCTSKRQGEKFLVVGEAGIGKSAFLGHVAHLARKLGLVTVGPLDLSATLMQDLEGSLEFVIHAIGASEFPRSSELLLSLSRVGTESVMRLRRELLNSFCDEFRQAATDQPIMVLFDSLEELDQLGATLRKFNDVCDAIAGHAVLIGASRVVPTWFTASTAIQLFPLDEDEINHLAEVMYMQRGETLDLSDDILRTISVKSAGRPILAAAALDWILETGDIRAIVEVPTSEFGRELVVRLRDSPRRPEERTIILCMAVLNRGVTEDLLVAVLGGNTLSQSDLRKLERFSFVKGSASSTLSLHDEYRRLLLKFAPPPSDFTEEVLERAATLYFLPRLASGLRPALRRAAAVDGLHYLDLTDPGEARRVFDAEYQREFDEHNLSQCRRLLSAVTDQTLTEPARWCLEGELLLAEGSPLAAAPMFEKVCRADIELVEPDLVARSLDGLAHCALSGSEIIGSDIAAARPHLLRAASLTEPGNLRGSLLIDYHLAMVDDLSGRHDEALASYRDVAARAEAADITTVAIQAADRLVQLSRRIGDVPAALKWAQKSDALRTGDAPGIERGRSLHQLANTYRDGKKYVEAIDYLTRSIELLEDADDSFGVAWATKDLGWTHFVAGNHDAARHSAEQAIELSRAKGFDRIRGEALHTIFEIVDRKDGEIASVPILEEALELCRNSGALFMLLDLLMHRVIIDQRIGRCDDVEGRVAEIRTYIDAGCRYHYFLGRALAVWGDCAFDDRDYEVAQQRYAEAYHQLALGGDSAYWASYKKYVVDHLPAKLAALEPDISRGVARHLLEEWSRFGLQGSHPEMVVLCRRYLHGS